MKTHSTIAGNAYVVYSKDGCTVTDSTGTLNKEVPAGDFLTIPAPSDALITSDDNALVRKANFKYARLALRMLGAGNTLPAGYTRLEYLESSGTQHIETGCQPNNETGLMVNYQPVVWENTFVAGAYDVNTDSRFYLPKWSSSSYRLFGWGGFGYFGFNIDADRALDRWQCELNFKNNRLASVRDLDDGFYREDSLAGYGTPKGSGTIPQFSASLPLFGRFDRGVVAEKSSIKLFSAKITQGENIVVDFVPALDATGAPCLYDKVSRTPFYNAGTGQFVVGMTLAQVRGLRLPAGGGELTLSLPHEASIDKQAQAALEGARANGWVLTLQYTEAEVPAGYGKLDFLESTGTQWVDTGYVPDNETGILLDQEKLRGSDTIPLGARVDNGGNTRFYAVRTQHTDNDVASPGYGWGSWCRLQVSQIGRQTTKLNYMNSRKAEGGNVENLPDLPFVPTLPIYMFAANIARNPGLHWTGRIYRASITHAGEMQADYVPCIAPNGKLGMYNRVDGTMLENAGSGAFIAGLATVTDVHSLWLPETGGPLTVSVPAETPDSAVEQLRKNNPSWQIAIQYRTENNEN